MKSLLRSALLALIPALALMALGSAASASTLNQNVSWTIDRAGTTTKYRVVAYGDSIYAGYNGSTTNAAKYSAPTVDAEYLSALWNADIESVRRTKSGAVASDIYNNKIVAERSYMQNASTRAVSRGPACRRGRLTAQARPGARNQSPADASAAAMRVGYESASQFSREFKRYFGVTPGEDASRIRTMQGA